MTGRKAGRFAGERALGWTTCQKCGHGQPPGNPHATRGASACQVLVDYRLDGKGPQCDCTGAVKDGETGGRTVKYEHTQSCPRKQFWDASESECQCTCGGPYIVDKDGSLRTDYLRKDK